MTRKVIVRAEGVVRRLWNHDSVDWIDAPMRSSYHVRRHRSRFCTAEIALPCSGMQKPFCLSHLTSMKSVVLTARSALRDDRRSPASRVSFRNGFWNERWPTLFTNQSSAVPSTTFPCMYVKKGHRILNGKIYCPSLKSNMTWNSSKCVLVRMLPTRRTT